MGKKPSGKKKTPNYGGLKEARAACRENAIKGGRSWWPLCWNKVSGYYAPDSYDAPHSDYICFVNKDGSFTCVDKKTAREHPLLKGYKNPAWYQERR